MMHRVAISENVMRGFPISMLIRRAAGNLAGSLTRTVARFSSAGRMAHDHLVCPPPISPEIIHHAVWLYVRFTLSYRDVEDLLAERGLDVSYETVPRRVLKFGPLFPRDPPRGHPRPTARWRLDEMAVMIVGWRFWRWRAVDDTFRTWEAATAA
jgi:hypothetical protein